MSTLSPYVFLLLLTSVFSPHKLMVFGSSAHEQQTFTRPDPLRGFKNYKGGYNVTNRHYLASAVFTGVHSYAIAGVWLLCGLGFGIFVIWKNLTRSDSSQVEDYLNHHFLLMFFLIILFTLLSMIATGLVLAANEISFYRTQKFKGTIVEVGKDTHRKIHKVIIAMTEMQQLLRPYVPNTALRLYTITHLLASEAQSIRDFVQMSGHEIEIAIRTSHIFHLVVMTFNLELLVASLVLLLLHWHPGFVVIIFFFWILTTTCWALTGFDFFFQTFVDDTCRAVQEFESDPQSSDLSSMIPCLSSPSSDKVLKDIGRTIYKFIAKLNWKIEVLYMLLPLDRNIMELIGVKKVCAPFSGPPNYTYIPDSCSKDSITLSEFSNILSTLTCHKYKSPETCTKEGKFIPESISNKALAYSQSVQNMISLYPDLESLARCSVVKTTFSDVVKHQCKPFMASIRMLWLSMLSLSIFMMISVLTWVAKAYQERGRRFSRCSIVPEARA